MTQFPDLFAALAAEFESQEVRARQQAGRSLHYITARTAMNRLDSVLGPENWWDDYTPAENSVLCRLTIRLPDGSTLTKADAGGYAGMPDSGDDDKSGFSDSFKRACVKMGVGRYLYRDGVPAFVRDREPGPGDTAGPPAVPAPPPAPAPPTNGHVKERRTWGNPRRPDNSRPIPPPSGGGKAPATGKALFAWTKDQEQRHEVGLLKYLNGWARLHEFPARMVDWDADQVGQGHAEAVRKLRAMATGDHEVHEEAMAS